MLKSLPCGRVLISSRRTAGLPEIGKIEVPLEEGQGRGGGLQGPGPPRGTPRRAASARASISARQSRSDVARSRRWGGAAWARGEPGLGAGGGRGGRPAAGDVRGRAVPCCLRRLRPRQPRELQEVRGRCRLFPRACPRSAPSGSARTPRGGLGGQCQAGPAGTGLVSPRQLRVCVVLPLPLSLPTPAPVPLLVVPERPAHFLPLPSFRTSSFAGSGQQPPPGGASDPSLATPRDPIPLLAGRFQ